MGVYGQKKRRKNSCGGTTLAEMIVVFALLGVLLVCLTTVLVSSMGVFNRVRSLTDLQSVGELLLDKVTGELSGAQTGAQEAMIVLSDGSGGNGAPAGSCISLYDRSGSHIYITTGTSVSPGNGGELLIHYYPASSATGVSLDAVDWTFDSGVYLGCQLDSLLFTRSARQGNLFQVELTLSKNGVAYSTSRMVECYNFTAVEDMAKIRSGPVQP